MQFCMIVSLATFVANREDRQVGCCKYYTITLHSAADVLVFDVPKERVEKRKL